jgi:hypothetical protein
MKERRIMLKALWRTVSALAVLASLATTADAGIDFGVVKLSYGTQIGGGGDGPGSVYGDGAPKGGPFSFTVQSGSILPTGTLLTTYCLQLNQTVASATYHLVTLDMAPTGGPVEPDSDASLGIGYDPNAPHMSNEAVALLQELYGAHYSGLTNTGDANDGAFQLNVWAMEYFGKQLQVAYTTKGGPLTAAEVSTATSGHVDFSANATALSWLNTALGPKSHGTYIVLALINPNSTAKFGTAQDQIITFDGKTPPLITVPEPASLAVWGMLGLVGIAYGRRRKQA